MENQSLSVVFIQVKNLDSLCSPMVFGCRSARSTRGGIFFNHAIILKKCFICVGIYDKKIVLADAIGWRIEKAAGGW